MNSQQIEYFLEASECLSFTVAAERLFTAQPSISRQIGALERELGHPLFDRSNKNRIVLTEAGRIYRELFLSERANARKAADAAARAEAAGKRSVRIGLPEEWDVYPFVNRCVRVLRHAYPDAEPEFEAHTFHELYKLLEEGHLDLAFCVETTLKESPSYTARRIGELPLVILLSRNNPLAACVDPPLTLFRDEPLYILPEDETPLNRRLLHCEAASLGFSRQIVIKPNRATILLALDSGRGCATFDRMNRYAKSDRFVSFPFPGSVPICAITPAGREDAVARLLTEQMTEFLAGTGEDGPFS